MNDKNCLKTMGVSYLKTKRWIKWGVLSSVLLICDIMLFLIYKKSKENETRYKNLTEKDKDLVFLLEQWIKKKQEGKDFAGYFQKNGIKSIAIYGMSFVGEQLYEELKDSEIKIRYAIDKSANGIYVDIDVISPDDKLPEVDAVVVTPVYYYDEIKKNLAKKIDCPILSLETVLHGS